MTPSRAGGEEARAPRDDAALIGLDWGTTSLRGWLFDTAGQVLDRREAALGVLAIREQRFAQAFESFCEPWLAAWPRVPAILSGMVGSRQGWREAPYVHTPAGFDALVRGLLALDGEAAGRTLRIVPGLVTDAANGCADVLRGEETQIFGALSREPGDAAREHVFVLPGTHSKWVRTQGDRVLQFHTCMTGEIYSVLLQHSILGRLCPPEGDDANAGSSAAFDLGVDRALAEPHALSSLLFTVRTEGLLGRMPAGDLRNYLSGLLIGSEVAQGRGHAAADVTLSIIAAPQLAARYLRAIQRAGMSGAVVDGEPASAGLFAIARRAGMIGA